MTFTLYAAYESCEDAERVFGTLLEIGVPTEDLGLVCACRKPTRRALRRALQMVDSGQVHLAEVSLGMGRFEAEGVEGLESAVGAGIATSTYDDDVSGVEEMDDASNIAENLAEPLNERWLGLDDLEDADKFAQLGTIDSTRPTGPNFAAMGRRKANAQETFTAMTVDHAIVMGDGPLATMMLTYALLHHESTAHDALLASLRKAGVAAELRLNLVRVFASGGAILAFTETPGAVPIARVERLVEAAGGLHMTTFVQVPG